MTKTNAPRIPADATGPTGRLPHTVAAAVDLVHARKLAEFLAANDITLIRADLGIGFQGFYATVSGRRVLIVPPGTLPADTLNLAHGFLTRTSR